jgi:hypothetical protein
MGTFAETANVDYRLLFADQEKHISSSNLQNKWKFAVPFSVYNKQREVAVSR